MAQRSFVHNHFILDGDFYICQETDCGTRLKKSSDGSTSSLLKHLNRHGFDGGKRTLQTESRRNIEKPAKQRKIDFQGATSNETAAQNERILRFFAAFNVPFQAVESPEFAAVLRNAGRNSQIPSRHKLSGDILSDVAGRYRREKIELLRNNEISLSMDEYSAGCRRFLSVTANFITAKWAMRTVRLDIDSLETEAATADNLSRRVSNLLVLHGTSIDKVSGVTRDGGANMVKTTKLLNLESIHCFDHCLHLALSDAFKSKGIERLVTIIKAVVCSFKHSAIASSKLKEITSGRMLKMANATRWNSLFAMVKSFMELRNDLITFSHDPSCRKMAQIQAIFLSDEIEDNDLQQVCKILSFFETVTRMAEGRDAFASIIPYLIYRVTKYAEKPTQSQCSSAVAVEFLSTFSDSFALRRTGYDRSSLLKKISFFDPRFVFRKEIYSDEIWNDIEKDVFRELQSVQSNKRMEALCPISDEEGDMFAIETVEDGEWESLDDNSNITRKTPLEIELEVYLSSKRLAVPTPEKNNNSDVLEFWRNSAKQLPLLAGAAAKYLPIVASSAEPERVFSGITHLLSNTKRASLSNAKIEKLTTVNHHIAMERIDNFRKLPYDDKISVCDADAESDSDCCEETGR